MKNYILGIGGSGSRVLRAVIHNCAAGIIDADEINVMVIDADQRSAAWDHLKKDYKEYQHIYELFNENRGSKLECFKTKVNFLSRDYMISPVDYSRYRTLRQSLYEDRSLEEMMQWLYTEEEMDTDLKDGFFARPNVGCVFFSNFINPVFNNFLEEMVDCIDREEKVNVMLIGSVFGGTGASGLPTILKLIDRRIRDSDSRIAEKAVNYLNVGAVFMMPYFKAKNVESIKNPLIEMEKFNLAAKEALKYYKEGKYFEVAQRQWSRSFQNLYLISQQTLDLVNIYAEGGEKQDNKPHIAEEYGALAVQDFLKKAAEDTIVDQSKTGVFSYEIGEDIGWNDFPFSTEEIKAEKRLGELTRFSTVYHACIFSYIEKKENKDKPEMIIAMPQWYKTYLYHKLDEETVQKIDYVDEYCKCYLRWASMLQKNMKMQENDIKGYYHNDKIKLFGEIISKVVELTDDENDGSKIIKNIKDIKKNFGQLICSGKEIGYALKEIFIILSRLGVMGALGANTGIAGLVTSLYQLIGQ